MKLAFLLAFFILFTPFILSQNYYADLNIELDSEGYTSIEGPTNYEMLLSENSPDFTFKEGSLWLFNLSIDEAFDFVYSLKLPYGAEINYVKTSGQFRIQNEKDYLFIKGYGENEPISIFVQYEITKRDNSLFWFFLLIFLVLVFLFYLSLKSKFFTKSEKMIKDQPVNFDSLTFRQKEIMKFLISNNKPVVMNEIVKKLNLPKSSVSRNISTLELKGLIEKENVGVSTVIKLKN